MIITILPKSTTFHAIAYNEKKVPQGLAELIEVRNIHLRPEGQTADNLQQYFEDYTSMNTRIKNGQFHVSVSCKGTEYTHRQLLDIGHRYLEEMGYAEEGQPLLVYAHHDTPNNHIHIITNRVAPNGQRISDKFEKKRSLHVTKKIMEQYTGQKQEPTPNEVATAALDYRYTSKAQFCSILESQGYECKDDDDKPIVHLYRGGEELGYIRTDLIMQHALRENNADEQRRRQLRAILQKYRNLSANKEELAAAMKKKFGISLVYLGRKDNPYGYFVIDHKNKTVHKGGEFLSIKELLQFEDAQIRFAKIDETINGLLQYNPNLTTKDVNKILYRQFGTRIHKGSITWNNITIELKKDIQEQLRHNYRVSKGMPVEKLIIMHIPQQQEPHAHRPPSNYQSLSQSNNAGSTYANREHEVGNGNGMDMSVDNEERQRSRWKR